MCLIIDNDSFGVFLKKEKDTLPIHKWLQKSGNKLAFSNYGKFEEEYADKYREELKRYLQAGKVKSIDKEKIKQKITELKKLPLKSNDAHIVALSIVANAKVVFTADQDLHEDIKNIAKGSIYQNAKHAKLLKPDMCP